MGALALPVTNKVPLAPPLGSYALPVFPGMRVTVAEGEGVTMYMVTWVGGTVTAFANAKGDLDGNK